MDLLDLILESKTEKGKGSSSGRGKMLSAKGKPHTTATKSKIKIYNSINREDPYEKIAILFESISNTKIRNMLINKFVEWKNINNFNNTINNSVLCDKNNLST